jgi:hypothetical protein
MVGCCLKFFFEYVKNNKFLVKKIKNLKFFDEILLKITIFYLKSTKKWSKYAKICTDMPNMQIFVKMPKHANAYKSHP